MRTWTLIHRTLETGHERVFPLSEVEPGVLEQLRPLVQEGIKSGQPLHVGANYWIAACEDGGRLVASIWHGAALGDPLVSMTVTRASGDALPLLEVLLVGVANPRARVSPEVAGALGDLERCVAWCWLAPGTR